MPSELMDSHGLSPCSFLSEEVEHPNEKRSGFRKTDGMPDNYGLKDGKVYAVGDSSVVEKQMSSDAHQMLKRFDVYRSQDHKVQISLGAGSHSLRRGVDNSDKGNRSNLNNIIAGTRFNAMGDHYENGLFSSSLSDLFSRKMRLSANNGMHGHSVGAAGSQSQYEEEEPFESLEEIEAQTIGNLLPDDDDLLSGVTDGLDCKVQPDDVEELDFFSSVGGMDLGDDGNFGEQLPQSHVENPSRTLFVRNINSNVEDSELRILFEQYGEIRTLYTACKHRGFVMISYYDIRAARRAMQALQNKPLRRRKLDIHYSIPKDNPSDKDVNQGRVVIYNLDSGVSNDELCHIFGVYGEVKEIHQGSRHKSIEFYDVRAAEAALRELNKGDNGMNSKRNLFAELDVDETSALLQMCSPPTEISGPGSHVKPGSGSMSMDLQHGLIPSAGGGAMNQLKYDFRNYHHPQPQPQPQPHSLPEYQDPFLCNSPTTINCRQQQQQQQQQQQFNSRLGRSLELSNDNAVFGSSGSGSGGNAHPYMWNPSPSPSHNNMMWPNSTSLMNAAHSAPLVHALPRAPTHHVPPPNTFMHINNHNHNHHHHHVGSAPSVNPSIWDRRHSYAAGESPADASVFHPASLGNMNFLSHTMFPHMGMGDIPLPMPIPSKTIHHQFPPTRGGGGQMIPINVIGGSFDSSSSSRIRRNEASSNQPDSKKQFELDLDRIMRGDDRRTTLMIKNIPNKYTSKMLLAAIDERHRGTYDFIYLPIDFKNKCNVGYAFINMTEPSLIVPFYQAFNGKKWEKFNSEKVASLAYARIQGKAALIAHFQNSSLMNEDKRCRPILFHTDGPNAGDQVPFPMGVNVRSRVNNKNRNSTNNEDVGHGEASSNGDSSSGSTKDFEC